MRIHPVLEMISASLLGLMIRLGPVLLVVWLSIGLLNGRAFLRRR
jgi:hypothetical protein